MQRLSFFSFLKHSIPKTIWAIGISSLLINLATSVVFSGSALYLKTVLGVAVSTIGLIEAIVEGIAYSIRIFSGIISDYFKKRKILMIIGFIMLTISKPLLAFSKTFMGIFLARAIDRIGNGIQATPREALISDSSPKEIKGACFGLRQSLALIGSTLGGLFGIVVMFLSKNNFQLLFLLAGIPALIAVVILTIFVKEKQSENNIKNKRRKIKLNDLILLGWRFWILMLVVIIFMFGRFSEVFISLHACGNFGLNLAYGTAITMIFNLLSTIVAYPTGKLSDKIDRTSVLLIGFVFLFLAHISMGFATNLIWIFFGTVLWGIQRGMNDSLFSTLISDYIPKELRGTGFGVYYLIVSASTAFATIIAGIISQKSGEGMAFICGSVFATVAICLLIAFRKKLKNNSSVN